jgi:hypothetical protein
VANQTTIMAMCVPCGAQAPHQVTGFGRDKEGKFQDLTCAQCGTRQRVYNWKPTNAREKLVHLSEQFVIDNDPDQPAVRVCISPEDEAALESMTRGQWGGDIADRVKKDGIRKACTTFGGLPVSWDAVETHFE